MAIIIGFIFDAVGGEGEEIKALFDGCKVRLIVPSKSSEPALETVPQLSNIVRSGRMEGAPRDQVYGQQIKHADTVTGLYTHTPVHIPSQMGTDVKVRASAQIECTDRVHPHYKYHDSSSLPQSHQN